MKYPQTKEQRRLTKEHWSEFCLLTEIKNDLKAAEPIDEIVTAMMTVRERDFLIARLQQLQLGRVLINRAQYPASPCPLCPRKRTSVGHRSMSAMCH
jgi:hypothetical protein